MKVILYSLLGCLLLIGCKKESGKLDPDAKISVTGVRSLTKGASDWADIPADGIAHTGITDSLEFITKYAWECQMRFQGGSPCGRAFGFMDDDYYILRDLNENKLKFWGTDAISAAGSLGNFITSYTDMVVVVAKWEDGTAAMPLGFDMMRYNDAIFDTVAYIPNSVVLNARAKITTAFDAGDYETCYRLFDDAYVFLPITGAKWRALKAAGIE